VTHAVALADVMHLDRDEVAVDPSANYSVAGVRSFGRGLFDRETISGAATSYPKLYRLRTDQIVMSRLFAWEGAVAVVTAEFAGKFVSSEFPTFTIDTESADPGYVGHFVRWPGLHERLANAGRGLGQRRQRVHAEDFLAMELPLLPIDEQPRVAAQLDHVESTSRELRERTTHASTLNDALVVSAAVRLDLTDDAKRRAHWEHVALGDVLEPSVSQVPVEPPRST
jgi:type I restriction enzyme, S subunit